MILLISLIILGILLACLIFLMGRNLLFGQKAFFSFFEKLEFATRVKYGVGVSLFVIFLWVSLSFIVDDYFLPSPLATLSAFKESFVSGELITNTLTSVYRIGIAFFISSLIGVLIGSVIGTFARVEALFQPVNSAIRYIPPTAFIGLSIIWLGIGEPNKIALISFAILFYIIQMIADAVRLVPRVFVEAAQVLGANRWEIYKRIILSSSIADILAVLRVNLGAAWTFLIVAELVSAQNGIGYLMAHSQRFLETPKLFALIIWVGFLGFLSDSLIALAIRYYSKGKHASY